MKQEERKQKYLASEGSRCPYCDSQGIIGGEVSVQDDAMFRNIVCEDCEKQWTETFTLTDVTFEEENE